jgi:hypothetical protein
MPLQTQRILSRESRQTERFHTAWVKRRSHGNSRLCAKRALAESDVEGARLERPIRVPSGKTPEALSGGLQEVKRCRQKYSILPKFGFVVCCAHLTRYEGRIASRHDTWVGCGGRGSVSTQREGQGGQRIEPNPVSPHKRARRTALQIFDFDDARCACRASASVKAEIPRTAKPRGPAVVATAKLCGGVIRDNRLGFAVNSLSDGDKQEFVSRERPA